MLQKMSQRNANQCSLFNYPFMNKFGFSNNNTQAAPQPEMTIEDTVNIENNSKSAQTFLTMLLQVSNLEALCKRLTD